jgi:Protein of unknown function (DUF2442)
MAKWKLTERSIKDQLNAAKLTTRLVEAGEPRAKSVYYDPKERRVVLALTNGADFRFPVASVPELAAAPESEIKKVEISTSGTTLRWKTLNADLSLAGLMLGIFGPRSLMAQVGSVGGRVVSPAKAAAARANGQKGGRPVAAKQTKPLPGLTSGGKSHSLRFAAKKQAAKSSSSSKKIR